MSKRKSSLGLTIPQRLNRIREQFTGKPRRHDPLKAAACRLLGAPTALGVDDRLVLGDGTVIPLVATRFVREMEEDACDGIFMQVDDEETGDSGEFLGLDEDASAISSRGAVIQEFGEYPGSDRIDAKSRSHSRAKEPLKQSRRAAISL